jgi:uncharacterized protein
MELNATDSVGTVSSLWRFPVKSMLGEELEAADVTDGGIVGDRAFALVDRETGKVASAKHPTVWPHLLSCRAGFVEAPVDPDDLPPARIELADGTSVMSDAPDVDAVLSRFFGRDVELASAARGGYRIDQYHPDVENVDPAGHRDEVTEIDLGAAFFRERGLPSAVPEGSFFDLFPLSVLTTSTLDRLAGLAPQSRFDVRRFRMNVIVDTAVAGFVENDWVGLARDRRRRAARRRAARSPLRDAERRPAGAPAGQAGHQDARRAQPARRGRRRSVPLRGRLRGDAVGGHDRRGRPGHADLSAGGGPTVGARARRCGRAQHPVLHPPMTRVPQRTARRSARCRYGASVLAYATVR